MADNGERPIKVPEQFAKKARIGSIEKYRALDDRSISDPDGFSAESLKNRIQDCGSEIVITADGGYRGGRIVPLKQTTDESLKECPGVKTVVVLKRTGKEVPFTSGRDRWWHDVVRDVPAECEP